jgi:hypothetical protein
VNDGNAFQKFVHGHCQTERMSGHLSEQHMLVLARMGEATTLFFRITTMQNPTMPSWDSVAR